MNIGVRFIVDMGASLPGARSGVESWDGRHGRVETAGYNVSDHPCGYSRLRKALALAGVVTFMLAAS